VTTRAGAATLLALALAAEPGCAARVATSGPSGTPAERPAPPEDAPPPPAPAARDPVAERRAARDRAPADVPAHLAYVAALVEAGRRSQAREEYDARARAPGAREIDRVLAERLRSDGASSSLRRVYAAAAARDSASPWWPLGSAEVELAEADACNQRRLAARDRGDPALETKAYRQARGALARAGEALAEAARLGPALADVEVYRGHLRALEGDLHAGAAAQQAAYRAAVAAFQRALARDRDLVEAWAGLADVRQRLGESGPSLAAWLEVARRSPADAVARENVARLLQQEGRRREAAQQYRALAVLRPADGTPWLHLGDVLADDERWEPALRAYETALQRDATLLEAHARMGAVLEHRGRLSEAHAAYQRYVDQGGPRRAEIERRIERLLHAEPRR
jgi:tetratricopeptide (TPR) repeat protein